MVLFSFVEVWQRFINFSLFFSGADQVGEEISVINASHILVVSMAIVMDPPGNAFVIQTGVAYYVIKVRLLLSILV